MTTTIEAIYEDGVLRLREKPDLENGARVRVTIQSNGAQSSAAAPDASTRASTLDESGRVPFDPKLRAKVEARALKNFDPEKVRDHLRATAALPIEGADDGFSGKDHDRVLYGWNKEE